MTRSLRLSTCLRPSLSSTHTAAIVQPGTLNQWAVVGPMLFLEGEDGALLVAEQKANEQGPGRLVWRLTFWARA
jgi:hypothetical protein